MVDQERAGLLKEIANDLPDVTLTDRHLCDLELIATGAFSPLKGFMARTEYESVLDRMRLQDDTLWPVPICLDVSETTASALEGGQSVALRDPEGFLLAVMHIEDMWPVERQREAELVYGTTDVSHPGVRYLFQRTKEFYLGGEIEVISRPLHFDFKQARLSPAEVRTACAKLGWQRIVGFQTRHPIHRPQFEMIISAMRQARANLLLQPIVGMTHPGDFDHYTRVRCHQSVHHYFPPDSHIMALLPMSMRMAGPREAVWRAIVAKNYGCSHHILSPGQGYPPESGNSKSASGRDESREILSDLSEELGIEIVPFEEMAYLTFEDEYRQRGEVPEGAQVLSLNGDDIRTRIRTGRKIPDWATFPEVVRELRRAYPPPRRQGFTVFCTGLSGAGKSTIAKVLYSRFLEMGDRPVTLLDGDIVRHNLSSQLGFSKEHRDINVRRIGFVASEITKNRGIAICAPIAPYERTRNDVRAEIQQYGGFIEVHVSTPLDVCESRDRKGMYAKARAGLIKGFTGVDDPYETPPNPEVSINTAGLTPEEAAQEILLFLGQAGYI